MHGSLATHALDDLEFLSNALVALAELRPEEDLFKFVTDRLAELAPDGLVITISYDPRAGTAKVCAAVGPEDMLELARQLAGEPLGTELFVDEQARRILSEGKLVRVEGGMHQLTFGGWPLEFARSFEKRLGILAIYGQPFSRMGDFLGAVAILSRVPTLHHSRLIEVFVRLAAVAIQRRRVEARLREADRLKTEFLAVLSHELRNPLGAIRNAVYVLGRAELGSEPAQRARGVIDRQIEQLTRLIDDLLDMTRITCGKIRLQRERLDLNALVRATVEDHRSMFAANEIDFELAPVSRPVNISGDRTRIAQIIDNLLQNAAKFTPKHGRASVWLGADQARKQAVLRVHNTGATIPPNVLAHLFEPFVQADRTLDRSKGGLGLGLALVKGLVEMHGGSVQVESTDLDGTTFTVRLPLARMAPKVGRPSEPPRGGARRVLVIEDNTDAAESLRDVLELHQNTVILASSGAEGIEVARTMKPDVVICDIGLPVMNGYEVARVIRADPDLKALALVALSGYASREDIARARDAGFDRHVAKPLNIEALERVLSEVSGGASR